MTTSAPTPKFVTLPEIRRAAFARLPRDHWNFGDGAGDSLSTLQNPVHQYQTRGDWTVTLVVSNAGGSATKVRTITVTN